MEQDPAEELERFRQQWQEEVTAKGIPKGKTTSSKKSRDSGKPKQSAPASQPLPTQNTPLDHEEGEDERGHDYHDLQDKDEAKKLGESGTEIHPSTRLEPSSALEHYERAVEREGEGNLGDSLNHYRQAYRLDAAVDRAYKHKHFPPTSSTVKQKLATSNSPDASVTVPDTTHRSSIASAVPISDLVASFAIHSIEPEPAPTDASPPLACPIANVPSELFNLILYHTADLDLASFARLALVCRRFAYLVATEEGIWRQVCSGHQYGFAGMHYEWNTTLSGRPLPSSIDDLGERLTALTIHTPPPIVPLIPPYPTYRAMLYARPRIRFSGCYISTVNYIRPGAATATQATWNSPVLIVTYYRYLRFFRDGTCVSLLTTTEPVDVVHQLTRENMQTKNHPAGLPAAVMNQALRGRWRLSGDPYGVKRRKRGVHTGSTATVIIDGDGNPASSDPICEDFDHGNGEEDSGEEEGILHIETEGADAGTANPKYLYKVMLKLQHASSSSSSKANGGARGGGKTRNSKLAWMGYWSYNRLTDDWAEFGLRNDRAFFWSRVKSYGDGE